MVFLLNLIQKYLLFTVTIRDIGSVRDNKDYEISGVFLALENVDIDIVFLEADKK